DLGNGTTTSNDALVDHEKKKPISHYTDVIGLNHLYDKQMHNK
ncbi:15290_t:CDS:1, partial [Funneliformis mosseae]